MLAVSGGRLILMSTPNGRRGHFFEAWEGDDCERVEVRAEDCPRRATATVDNEDLMPTHQPVDGVVHQHLIGGMIDAGRCPSVEDLSTALDVPIQEIKASLRRLEENHGVVLHPHECSVWMIHPFAVSPSNTWVQQGDRGWWAPCMWCALGVATLVGSQVAIHARIGGEAESVRIPIEDGHPKATGIYAHFALPPKHVWDNVHHYCAMLLPFKTEQQIDAWSTRHGLPRGEAVPILQAAALARIWYGRHADPDYRKWTPREAQKIFADVGLTGDFWELDSRLDRKLDLPIPS